MNYEAVAEHDASFPYSAELKIGDRVAVTDNEEKGWVWCLGKGDVGVWIPKAYIDRKGRTATMRVDYDSAELDVGIGEQLQGVKAESGWILCINSRGQRG